MLQARNAVLTELQAWADGLDDVAASRAEPTQTVDAHTLVWLDETSDEEEPDGIGGDVGDQQFRATVLQSVAILARGLGDDAAAQADERFWDVVAQLRARFYARAKTRTVADHVQFGWVGRVEQNPTVHEGDGDARATGLLQVQITVHDNA